MPSSAYVIETDVPFSTPEQWAEDLCEAPRQRRSREILGELDQPANIARAQSYLTDHPPAIQGAGGDDHTYKTACRLFDFGLSEPTVLDLLLGPWNERCQPPWPPDEMQKKVENAATFKTGATGKDDAAVEFAAVPIPANENQQGITPLPAQSFTPGTLPKRRWILGHTAIRGKLTLLIAPPGAGKSTYTIAAAVAVATGNNITGEPVHEQTGAWLINNEDDLEEMRRRLSATLVHTGMTLAQVPRLYMNSGETHRLVVARRTGQGDAKTLRRSQDVEAIIEHIKRLGIGLLIVDPFAETHEADENDNVQVREVAALYREIAQRADCAVILVHHTRKQPAGSSEGHAGNMDSGRGASSLAGVARVIQTLYGMSDKDAKRYGVPERERHLYVRLDDAKANLALLTHQPRWFRRVPVALPIDGGETESVGVLEPARLVENLADSEVLVSLVGEMVAAGPRRLQDLVAELTGNPLAGETSRDALRKRIQRAAEQPGAEWRIVTGKGKWPKVEAVKTRQAENPTENQLDG